MHDPSKILDRLPELRALVSSDPRLVAALATGDPRKLHRALWWGRLFGRYQGAQLDAALKDRRNFVDTEASHPALFTLNGFGTRLYGRSDEAPDGSWIGTQFFTMLYLPILPLDQYLLSEGGGDGHRSHGRVPFGPLTSAWRGLGGLGLLGLASAGALAAVQSARFNEVHLLNALAQPVQVQLGDQALTVAATASEVVTVPTGTVPVTVRLDSGEVLEEGDLEVPMLADAVAWNVAGASFLYLEHIAYVAEGAPPEDREPTIYCGERAVVVDDVDFPFEEPDEEVSMDDSVDYVWRDHVGVQPGAAMDCAAVLAQTGRTDEAAELARLLVDSGYESLDDLMISMWLTFHAQGPDAAGQWLVEQVVDSDDLDRHRLAQDFRIHVAGQLPAVRQLYRDRFQAAPEDPDAAYLYFRVAADTSQLPEWAERFPDHTPLHRSLAWEHLHDRRWADALAVYDHLADLDPNELWRTQYAAALAGAGRPEQALSVLSADPTDGQSLIHARILARRLGADAPSLDELSELDRVRVLAQTGEAVETDDPVAAIQAAAWQGPEAMMAAVEQAPPEEELDLETWLLAYAEARRSGREELAEALASSSPFQPADDAAITTWLADGTWDSTLDDLPLGSLAGLKLGRARQPGVPPQDAAALQEEAHSLAVLPSVLSEAALLW